MTNELIKLSENLYDYSEFLVFMETRNNGDLVFYFRIPSEIEINWNMEIVEKYFSEVTIDESEKPGTMHFIARRETAVKFVMPAAIAAHYKGYLKARRLGYAV